MVVKFFSNKKGGSAKAVNYLLNHREQEGTARVLQGDPDLTRQIINDIQFKQKTTVGCLSFEEQNISEEMKHQLIEDFERMLIPGLDKSRYNILWVEHTDKGRLELNFVIPKIELETQKSLNPYYHKADLPRVEKWQDLQNLKYNYSSPKDPSKERNVEINSHIKKFNKSYEELNETIQELANQGHIQNREQLIELLKNSGIEVTRSGKDYISVKLPESKKARKFKGGIYEQQFTSTREIETISKETEQRVRKYNNRNTQTEQQRLARELESYTREKEQKLREIYSKPRKGIEARNREPIREPNRVAQEQTTKHRENDRGQAGEREHTQNNINSNNNIHSNNSNNIRNSVFYNQQTVSARESENSILLHNRTQQGEINDSTRTRVIERTGTRESIKYKSYRETGKARDELLKVLTESANSIRKESISNSRELREEYANNTRDLQQRVRIIENEHKQVVQESESHLQQTRNLEHKSYGYTKLREFGRGIKNAIESTRELIKDKFNQIVDYYNKQFHYENEPLVKAVKELQSKEKYLGSETTLKDIKGLEQTFNNEMARDTIKHDQEQIKQQEQRQRHRGYSHEM